MKIINNNNSNKISMINIVENGIFNMFPKLRAWAVVRKKELNVKGKQQQQHHHQQQQPQKLKPVSKIVLLDHAELNLLLWI